MNPNQDPPKPAKQEELKKLIATKKKKLKKGQKAWNQPEWCTETKDLESKMVE